MTGIKARILVFPLFIAVLLSGCTKPAGPDTAGTVTETQNSALVSGRLCYADGSPARYSTVRFVAVSLDPHGVAPALSYDSVRTDSAGWYGINTLDTGVYNVLSVNVNASLKGFRDSLVFNGDTLPPQRDTLLPLGSLAGIVLLPGGGDPLSVTVDAIGALTYALPKASGEFSFTEMARGRYFVRIRSSDPKYEILDTVLPVVSGTDLVLTGPIVLPLKIPIPTGFALGYDTLKRTVSLSWNRMNPVKVKGYYVYRRMLDSAEVKLTPTAIADTFYLDNSGVQGKTYAYWVSSVNYSDVPGTPTSPETVTIVSAYRFIRDFGEVGTGVGQFSFPMDIDVDAIGNFWVVDANRCKVMKFDSSGAFILEWGIGLQNPVGIAIDHQGNILISQYLGTIIQKYDAIGNLIQEIDSAGIQIYDVCVDGAGNIYAAVQDNANKIYKYDPNMNFLKSWVVNSTRLNSAILAKNGKLYCAAQRIISGQSFSDNVIEIFDTSGTSLYTINARKDGETGEISIGDLEIDATGKLYAVISETGEVRVFDENSIYLTSFGVKGNGMGEFNSITGTAVSKMGTIAVSDRNCVHLFRLPK